MGKCGFPVKLSQALSFWVRCIDPKNPRRGQAPRRASAVGKRLDKSTCDLDRLEPPGWQTCNEGSSNTPGSEIHVESDELMRLRYICIDRQATIRRKSSTIHLDVRYEIQIASISVFHGIWWRMKQINRGTEHHDLRFPNALGSSSASFLKSLVEKKRYQAIIRFLTSKCCNSSILGFWTSVKQIKIPRSCSWLLSLAASSSFSTDTREPMVSPYGLICRLWARKKEKISQRFLWS